MSWDLMLYSFLIVVVGVLGFITGAEFHQTVAVKRLQSVQYHLGQCLEKRYKKQ